MPIQVDFSLPRGIDANLTIQVAPPTSASGWSVQFLMAKRFGSQSGLVVKSMASGFASGAVSGMTLIDGPDGIFNVRINAGDTSGLAYGAYTHTVARLDSGSRTTLAEGFVNLTPGIGG